MASPIILQFDDEPVIAKYDAKEVDLNDELSKFKQKYSSLVPDIEERFYFKTDDDELHFKLGEDGEYSSLDDEGNFIHVDFGKQRFKIFKKLEKIMYFRKLESHSCLKNFSRISLTSKKNYNKILDIIKN